jgi:hypothetical protein
MTSWKATSEGSSELQNLLREHLGLATELLELARREEKGLAGDRAELLRETSAARNVLLPRLKESLDKLRKHRIDWQNLTSAQRKHPPEVAALLRQTQDCIMRVLLLDRQNEKEFLRAGFDPGPGVRGENLPKAHYVADLYRRQNKS